MMKNSKNKTYTELSSIDSFVDRFRYLQLCAIVGDETFGSKRYLNQILYKTSEWKSTRNKVIIRDNGCDLGCVDRKIEGPIVVHHIDPISVDDILNRNPKVFDLDNLISSSLMTHNAIHYGDETLLIEDYVERKPYDTCPWKKGEL